MKKFIPLLLLNLMFCSCNDNFDQKTLDNNAFKSVEAKESGSSMSSKPPTENPIMLEFFVVNKNLSRADGVYRKHIEEAKKYPYYDNLRQYGFQALIKHGLIANGTADQKLYYINEQINSVVNLPNLSDFYSLLLSTEGILAKDEIIVYGNQFYAKNLDLIENQIKYPSNELKKDKVLQLKTTYKNFSRRVSLIKD